MVQENGIINSTNKIIANKHFYATMVSKINQFC